MYALQQRSWPQARAGLSQGNHRRHDALAHPVPPRPACHPRPLRPDDDAISHLYAVWNSAALVQNLQDCLPETCQAPTPELAVHRPPLTKLFGQITPRRACSCNPKNAIQHEAVIKQPYARWAEARPPKKGSQNAHSASGISYPAKTASYPKPILGHILPSL